MAKPFSRSSDLSGLATRAGLAQEKPRIGLAGLDRLGRLTERRAHAGERAGGRQARRIRPNPAARPERALDASEEMNRIRNDSEAVAQSVEQRTFTP